MGSRSAEASAKGPGAPQGLVNFIGTRKPLVFRENGLTVAASRGQPRARIFTFYCRLRWTMNRDSATLILPSCKSTLEYLFRGNLPREKPVASVFLSLENCGNSPLAPLRYLRSNRTSMLDLFSRKELVHLM